MDCQSDKKKNDNFEIMKKVNDVEEIWMVLGKKYLEFKEFYKDILKTKKKRYSLKKYKMEEEK